HSRSPMPSLGAVEAQSSSGEESVVSQSWNSIESAGGAGDGANGRLPSDAVVLVTGGAGFIGSHVANSLAEGGWRVRVVDSLAEQVHGAEPGFPEHLQADVERIEGDIRNRDTLRSALAGVTHVCHLAAAV